MCCCFMHVSCVIQSDSILFKHLMFDMLCIALLYFFLLQINYCSKATQVVELHFLKNYYFCVHIFIELIILKWDCAYICFRFIKYKDTRITNINVYLFCSKPPHKPVSSDGYEIATIAEWRCCIFRTFTKQLSRTNMI